MALLGLRQWFQVAFVLFLPIVKVCAIEGAFDRGNPWRYDLFAVQLSKMNLAGPWVFTEIQISAGQATQTIADIHYQHLLNQILGILTDMRNSMLWKLELARNDSFEQCLFVNVGIVIVKERICTKKHLINENTQRPNVCRFVMTFVQNYFRCLPYTVRAARKRGVSNGKSHAEASCTKNATLTMYMAVPQNVKVLLGTYLADKRAKETKNVSTHMTLVE
jgi:hypothetical protein